jgi:hypothetical protein
MGTVAATRNEDMLAIDVCRHAGETGRQITLGLVERHLDAAAWWTAVSVRGTQSRFENAMGPDYSSVIEVQPTDKPTLDGQAT